MSTTLQATELRRRRHECRLTRRQLARAASLDLAMIEDAEMYGMAIYQPAAIALTRQLGLDITGSQRERHNTGDSELIGAILADNHSQRAASRARSDGRSTASSTPPAGCALSCGGSGRR